MVAYSVSTMIRYPVGYEIHASARQSYPTLFGGIPGVRVGNISIDTQKDESGAYENPRQILERWLGYSQGEWVYVPWANCLAYVAHMSAHIGRNDIILEFFTTPEGDVANMDYRNIGDAETLCPLTVHKWAERLVTEWPGASTL